MQTFGRFTQFLHDEIVACYIGANVILAQLVVLGVIHLTPDKVAAWVSIIAVVFGPIVRGQVTPTGKIPDMTMVPTTVHNVVTPPAVAVAPFPIPPVVSPVERIIDTLPPPPVV